MRPDAALRARRPARGGCGSLRRRRHRGGDDDRRRRGGAAPTAPGDGDARSASSSSARRTTSATTRPPTRAARRSRRPSPTSRCSPPRTCPRPTRPTRVMEDMIDKGAEDHLRHQLRPPRPRAEGRRATTPTWSSSSRATSSRASRARQRRHLLRHRVRARVPGRHRGRARRPRPNKLGYVYAFPIPQTLANINAFQLGAQSVNPDVETITSSTVELVRPGQAGRGGEEPARPGRRRHHPAPGLHHDRSSRPPRRPAPTSVGYHADASALAPKGWLTGSEWDWGAALHRHRRRPRSPASSPAASTTPTTGSATRPATTRSCSRRTAPSVTDETKTLDRRGQARRSPTDGSPFAGPVIDQDGTERGRRRRRCPTTPRSRRMDCFVAGRRRRDPGRADAGDRTVGGPTPYPVARTTADARPSATPLRLVVDGGARRPPAPRSLRGRAPSAPA